MLEEYLKSIGKKVKFIVKSDESVKGFKELKIKYPVINKNIKKYYKRNKDEIKIYAKIKR